MSQGTKATTTRAVSDEEADAAVENFAELLKRSSEGYGLAMSAAKIKKRIWKWLDRTKCCDFEKEAILIVSKVYGIMTKDKLGNAKSFDETLHWMRRCAEFLENDAEQTRHCYRACL